MDVAIVGAGMAGLHTAVELLKKYPKLSVTVFEKYGNVGGRATTYKRDVPGVGNVSWEAGAGRISEKHTLVLGLMKRYKLKWIPIGGGVQYKATYTSPFEPNIFEPGIPAFLDPLTSLPAADLAKSTIRQLLTKIHGAAKTEEYLIRFPYRAEVETLRADEALRVFQDEMRAHAGYGICAQGLSALTAALRKDAEKRGVIFRTHHELVSVTKSSSPLKLEFRSGAPSEGPSREIVTIQAKHVVLAIPSPDAEKVSGISGWYGFKRLEMIPLLRFFGVFKEDWYKEYQAGGLIVTSTPVRFLIPGDGKYVQISYTDSQDAKYWMRRIDAEGEEKVGTAIVSELRKLLDPKIPSPVFVKSHAWDHGTTYWLPGSYSPATVSRDALTPFPDIPNLHLCGESYSLRQAWMEGALEHAEQLLEVLSKNIGR
jgi:monoamine oxidase